MDKLFESSLAVIAEIPDGANILFGGWPRRFSRELVPCTDSAWSPYL